MSSNTDGLREFVQTEIRKRNMSARQFAAFVGVSHTTIDRVLDPRQPLSPSLEFLSKLGQATATSLQYLVSLVYPHETETDPEAEILAAQISALPPEEREFIRTYLLGVSVRMAREESEK